MAQLNPVRRPVTRQFRRRTARLAVVLVPCLGLIALASPLGVAKPHKKKPPKVTLSIAQTVAEKAAPELAASGYSVTNPHAGPDFHTPVTTTYNPEQVTQVFPCGKLPGFPPHHGVPPTELCWVQYHSAYHSSPQLRSLQWGDGRHL